MWHPYVITLAVNFLLPPLVYGVARVGPKIYKSCTKKPQKEAETQEELKNKHAKILTKVKGQIKEDTVEHPIIKEPKCGKDDDGEKQNVKLHVASENNEIKPLTTQEANNTKPITHEQKLYTHSVVAEHVVQAKFMNFSLYGAVYTVTSHLATPIVEAIFSSALEKEELKTVDWAMKACSLTGESLGLASIVAVRYSKWIKCAKNTEEDKAAMRKEIQEITSTLLQSQDGQELILKAETAAMQYSQELQELAVIGQAEQVGDANV